MTVRSEPRTASCGEPTPPCDAGTLTRTLTAAGDDFALPPRLLRAVFAHELRAPLTPIMGMVQLYLHRYAAELSAPQRDMLEAIDRNSRRLVRLLDDLLILNADAVPGPVAHRRPQVLRTAVAEAVAHVAAAVEVTGDLDVAAMVDRRHLDQMLERLLDNAQRWGHTPIGVEVAAQAGRVQVRVTDHGTGVQGPIRPLWTVWDEARDQRAGLGLGLPVCQRLARANDATLTYHREDGRTCFLLELPAQVAQTTALGSVDALPETLARLLVADDVVAPLHDLVGSSLPRDDGAAAGGSAAERLRTLVQQARDCPATWTRWGDLLPGLAAAAEERAAGLLTPVRSLRRPRLLCAGRQDPDMLVALTIDGLPPDTGGDRPARAAAEDRLRRALTTRLGEHDAALRWPRNRFLVLLRHTSEARAERFAQGVAREWEARLGAPPLAGAIRVRATVGVVPAGDLAGAIRRVSAHARHRLQPPRHQ